MSSSTTPGSRKKQACSWVIAGLMAFAPTAPAFAADTTAFGNRADEFSLEDAYRLPAILVEAMNMEQDGATLRGSFTAYNGEAGAISGLQYHLEVWGTGAKDGVPFLRESVREPFALSGKQKKEIAFTLDASSLPAGDYVFRAQIVTKEGRSLGWNDAALSLESGAQSFLTAYATGETSPEWSGSLDPLSGPNVSPDGTLTLHAVLYNDSPAPVTAVPTLRISTFDLARGVDETLTYPAVTVLPGESKNVAVPVNASQKPEVYSALLSFVDGTDKTVSSLAPYRWVVKGADADVFPVQMQTLGTKAGEDTIVKVDVVGAADALTVSNAAANVRLLDEKGIAAQMTTPSLRLTDAIQSGVARLTLTRDLSGPATLQVIVKDENGTILADHREQLPASQGAGFAIPLGFVLLFLSALVGMALIVQVLSSRRRIGLRTALPGSLAAGLTCLMITMQLGHALAAGNGNGIEVVTPRDGSAWHGLQGPAVIALFINAPIHDASTGTYQRSSVPLQYRVNFAVCQNRVSYARVIGRYDANGGKQTTLNGTNANWQVIHDKTFSAGPTCPAGAPLGTDGAPVCYYNSDYNGSVNLSGLPAGKCSTTFQLIGKLGQSGLDINAGLPGPPTSAISPTDPSFAYQLVHGVNLWMDFCDNTPKPHCSDGQDNDGDGLVDANDPGCYSNGQYNPNDSDEFNAIASSSSSSSSSVNTGPQCSNGRDDDHDGKTDYQDPGCYQNGFYNPNDNDESDGAVSSSSPVSSVPQAAQCSDGGDNDGDGKTDAQDPGCYQNGYYNPNDNDEYNAVLSSSSSSSSSAYPCSWLGNCPQSSVSSSHGSVNPCGWSGCQPQSSSTSSAHCGGWCGWGLGNWFNANANANTTVNNQVNAGAQNNVNVQQWGWGTQNATVTPTANTTVNNQVNAGTQNNIGGWLW